MYELMYNVHERIAERAFYLILLSNLDQLRLQNLSAKKKLLVRSAHKSLASLATSLATLVRDKVHNLLVAASLLVLPRTLSLPGKVGPYQTPYRHWTPSPNSPNAH